MEIYPEAKMVVIQIVEVPHQWKGIVPDREIGSSNNSGQIKLVHVPTGVDFVVRVTSYVSNRKEASTLRAQAKLEFIPEGLLRRKLQ